MNLFLIVIASTVYGLIAAQVAYVGWKNEKRIGRYRYISVTLMAVVWPAAAVIVGLGTIIMGDAGIYDSSYKWTFSP